MKRYPEYKDSGISQLGKVPSHWMINRIKRVSTVNPAGSKAIENTENEAVIFLPMEMVKESGEYDCSYVVSIDTVKSGYTIFQKGDIIIAKITPCFENGKAAFLNNLPTELGFGSTEFHVIRPKSGLSDGHFLYFLTRTHLFMMLGEASMTGAAGQKRVPPNFVANFVFPLPSIQEQSAIAAFLDHKTRQIDELIAKKERLIELLKEERTGVINRAVTKGIDPDVPMKDSGIEWLGEIPVHWEVKKLGYLLQYISYGFTNPMPTTEDGVYMLTANDIRDGYIDFENARKTSKQAYSEQLTEKSRPKKDDLLLTKDGTLGRIAICPQMELCINQSVALLRLNYGFNVQFIFYLLSAPVYKEKMIYDAGGTTIKHIYISRLSKMDIAFPPSAEEQLSMLTFLKEEIARIDLVLEKTKLEISLLNEYKTSLINEAVTGKIDVRDYDFADA